MLTNQLELLTTARRILATAQRLEIELYRPEPSLEILQSGFDYATRQAEEAREAVRRLITARVAADIAATPKGSPHG
jgi:hypothetical protein